MMHNKDFGLHAESYIERRKLFKNVWDAAMVFDEKEVEPKSKIIKTQQVDADVKSATKRKKLRLMNLRHVCTKILDFCDKQEAEDAYREQLAAEGIVLGVKPESTDPKRRKIIRKRKRKLKIKRDDITVLSAQVKNKFIKEMSSEDDAKQVHSDPTNKKIRNRSPNRKTRAKRRSKSKKEQENNSMSSKKNNEHNKQITSLENDVAGDGHSHIGNLLKNMSETKKSSEKKPTQNSKLVKKPSKKPKLGSLTAQNLTSTSHAKRNIKRNSVPIKQNVILKTPIIRDWVPESS